MRRFATTIVLLACAALISGCSFLDFFGYEDNAPLHVVTHPSGYPSVLFGSQMAATSFRSGAETSDLVAVSAGSKYPTVIYRLSHNGKLVNVEDPWDEYLTDEEAKAEETGSGASLAGLPTWMDDGPYSGCFAVGEPTAGQIRIICEQDKERFTITDGATDQVASEFGKKVAAIPPLTGDTWLLAVASDTTVTVFSSSHLPASNRSETVRPTYNGDPSAQPIVELAAGRLEDDRFFTAATTSDSESAVPEQIHLFVQDGYGSTEMTEVACLNRSGEDGFGTVLATGDLDDDGNDELIVSARTGEQRVDAVYIWTIEDLISAAPTCNSDTPEPAAVVYPGEGPLSITCPEESGCEFGFSIGVGDIATDDDGPELIVGAPGARVGGTSQAGAVYVYRGMDVMLNGADGGVLPASRVSHSSPEKGYRFGGGLEIAPMSGRNELLVGATGKGHMVITYCTGVGEDIEEGADVTTNAGGSVVSTRCRPK